MDVAKNNVALLVHTCDRYAFLYKGFDFFFSRHWGFNMPCTYYFATEEKQVIIDGFKNIRSGRGEWSDRLCALLDKIPEEYIIYLQEDMWLNKDVNVQFFKELFALAIKNDWKQVKLHSSEVYTTIPTLIFIEGFNIARLDNKSSGYLMSHQITLWNKTFLREQLTKNENPWRNERRGTKRLKRLDSNIFHADYFAENGKPEINNNDQPVKRSEYQTISINGTLNSSVLPYIEILKNEDNAKKDYAEKLELHYQHNLTHDGKARPRKVDIFKKIKNWLRRGV